MTISDEHKEVIVRLADVKTEWKTIALAVNHSIRACESWYGRFQKVRDLPPVVVLRKPNITAHIGLTIKRMILMNPSVTIRELSMMFDGSPSRTTINKYMVVHGFNQKKKTRKMVISMVNRAKRVRFAQDNVNEPLDFFRNILWSDETMVKSNPAHRLEMYWGREGDDLGTKAIQAKKQQGGKSVMFWGCFSFWNWGPLVALEGYVNARAYVDILREYLIPELEEYLSMGFEDMLFMHDNARPHKAELTQLFLESKGVFTWDWPPQSPDCNPIELVWAFMKSKLYKIPQRPRTQVQITEAFFEIWNLLEDDYRQILSEAVPDRLQKVIDKKGDILK